MWPTPSTMAPAVSCFLGRLPLANTRWKRSKTMAVIAERTEREIDYRGIFYSERDKYSSGDVTNAISHATCTTAYDLGASAIITVTQSGHTARMSSRFRPKIPIIGCTPCKSTYYHLSMSWGVVPGAGGF